MLAQSKVTSLALEEVVVTAQKRAEDSQDVPISISALSETDLERRGVLNAGDLISTLPNMTGYGRPARAATSALTCGVSVPGVPATCRLARPTPCISTASTWAHRWVLPWMWPSWSGLRCCAAPGYTVRP